MDLNEIYENNTKRQLEDQQRSGVVDNTNPQQYDQGTICTTFHLQNAETGGAANGTPGAVLATNPLPADNCEEQYTAEALFKCPVTVPELLSRHYKMHLPCILPLRLDKFDH